MCLWSLRHCSLQSCQNIALYHGLKTAKQGPRAAAACAGERYRLTFNAWHPVKSSHEFGTELSLTESLRDCGGCECCPSVVPLFLSLLSLLQASRVPAYSRDLWLSCCCSQGPWLFWDIVWCQPAPCACMLCSVRVCVCIWVCASPLCVLPQEFARSANALNSSIKPQ